MRVHGRGLDPRRDAVEKYLQRKFHGKDKEGRVAATKEFVHSVIYRYLASVESGVRLT